MGPIRHLQALPVRRLASMAESTPCIRKTMPEALCEIASCCELHLAMIAQIVL